MLVYEKSFWISGKVYEYFNVELFVPYLGTLVHNVG